MRFPRNAKIFRGQLDTAPVVGVLFLLVIFLVLKSSLIFTPGIEIELPVSGELPGVAAPTLVVAIDRRGQIYYDNQATDAERLQQQIRAEVARIKEPVTLIIQADKSVPHEILARVTLAAREGGIQRALLATRPPLYSPASATPP